MTHLDDLIILRAHRPDRETLAAYQRLVKDFGHHAVVVAADELSSPAQDWPAEVAVVPITRQVIADAGLSTSITDSGWRCGDYALAAVLMQRPFERAWLVEPDVRFGGQSARDFTSLFDEDSADYVVYASAPQRPGGFWYGTLSSRGYPFPEWHSFFPLVRVTRRAVEAAMRLRREVQDVPSDAMIPNDETVLATAVANDGLTMTRMTDVVPGMFRRFSPGRRLPFLLLRSLFRGPQVFHPVGRPDLLHHRRGEGDVRRVAGSPSDATPPSAGL